MKRTIHFSIRREDQKAQKYVAECSDLPIVTEAVSLDALVANIEECVALFFQDEDPSEFGLAPTPVVLATLELATLQLAAAA